MVPPAPPLRRPTPPDPVPARKRPRLALPSPPPALEPSVTASILRPNLLPIANLRFKARTLHAQSEHWFCLGLLQAPLQLPILVTPPVTASEPAPFALHS